MRALRISLSGVKSIKRKFGKALLLPLLILPALPGLLINPYRLHLYPDEAAAAPECVDPGECSEAVRRDIEETVSCSVTIPETCCRVKTIGLDSARTDLLKVGAVLSPGCAAGSRRGETYRIREKSRVIGLDQTGNGYELSLLGEQEIRIAAEFPEQYLNRIGPGSEIKAYAYGTELQAELISSGRKVEDGTFLADIRLTDPGLLCRAGTAVQVSVVTERKEDVLCVPLDCLYTDREGGHYVLRRVEDNYERVPVRCGIRDREYCEICGGLEEHDVIFGMADYADG